MQNMPPSARPLKSSSVGSAGGRELRRRDSNESSVDPLTILMQPPANETAEQKSKRLKEEARAMKVSEEIDERLKKEKAAAKKRKGVKLLLVGQSESGKSTTLKQFLLLADQQIFDNERNSWRLIIYLNLVRSIRKILDALELYLEHAVRFITHPAPHPPMSIALKQLQTQQKSPKGKPKVHGNGKPKAKSKQTRGSKQQTDTTPTGAGTGRESLEYTSSTTTGDDDGSSTSASSSSDSSDDEAGHTSTSASDSPHAPSYNSSSHASSTYETDAERAYMERVSYYKSIRLRLLPLLKIEQMLIHRMTPGSDQARWKEQKERRERGEDMDADSASVVSGVEGHANGKGGAGDGSNAPGGVPAAAVLDEKEFFVRPESRWKRSVLTLSRGKKRSSGSEPDRSSVDHTSINPIVEGNTGAGRWWDEKDDPGHIVVGCAEDMIALWNDPWVKAVLREIRMRPEESGGFFLNDMDRVTAYRYIPTNDDILRARIKTIGVTEHDFRLARKADETPVDWRIYDVGGARSQRAAWAPFFDDVNSLIFLAPISAFDQVLAEDRHVNRVEDSLALWKEICSNRSLREIPFVLFLNKCDILDSKLSAGVQFNRYVLSYGDRPNELPQVARYLRSKFDAVRKQYSPHDRPVYVHLTSVIDTKTTSTVIAHVRDTLLRDALSGIGFL